MSSLSSCISPLVLPSELLLLGLSLCGNQSILSLYRDRACLDLYLGSLSLSLGFYWDQDNLNFIFSFCQDQGNPSGRGFPDLQFGQLEPQVRGQSRRTGGSWSFHVQIYIYPACLAERKKGNTCATSTHFPCFLQNCCSYMFRETHSLRRTMQIVECSLLYHQAQGRVSS